MATQANAEVQRQPKWALRPNRAFVLLWRAILVALLVLGAVVITKSARSPGWAEENDAVLGLLVLGAVAVLGSVAVRISSVCVSAFEDHLLVRKGLLRRPLTIAFTEIHRVVVHQVPSPDVVVYFGNRSVTVANSMSEFSGPIPEIAIDCESDSSTVGRMRRIASLIELQLENSTT